MRKILIEEDDAAICELLVDCLTQESFQVSEARDGKEALDLLKQEKSSLIVLLDVLMPHDGVQILDWLKEMQRLDHHKVVIMSASVQAKELRALLESGDIAGYLPKPFELEKLLTLIHQLAA